MVLVKGQLQYLHGTYMYMVCRCMVQLRTIKTFSSYSRGLSSKCSSYYGNNFFAPIIQCISIVVWCSQSGWLHQTSVKLMVIKNNSIFGKMVPCMLNTTSLLLLIFFCAD